jgi:hypothetical protein
MVNLLNDLPSFSGSEALRRECRRVHQDRQLQKLDLWIKNQAKVRVLFYRNIGCGYSCYWLLLLEWSMSYVPVCNCQKITHEAQWRCTRILSTCDCGRFRNDEDLGGYFSTKIPRVSEFQPISICVDNQVHPWICVHLFDNMRHDRTPQTRQIFFIVCLICGYSVQWTAYIVLSICWSSHHSCNQ